MKLQSKFIHFHSRKSIWNCLLENGGHFVSALCVNSTSHWLSPYPENDFRGSEGWKKELRESSTSDCFHETHLKYIETMNVKSTCNFHGNTFYISEREREIKFIGLFENRGHRGPYSPYKPFNHNLYIGIIIFPHIDNPQYTGYDLPKKKPNKIINEKKWGPH